MPSVENLSIKGAPKSDHKSEAEAELEKIESKLRTIQLSLEILTGVCATIPDPEATVPEGGEEGDELCIHLPRCIHPDRCMVQTTMTCKKMTWTAPTPKMRTAMLKRRLS
jgi:hypothetical protein